jgi:hypothetical protein
MVLIVTGMRGNWWRSWSLFGIRLKIIALLLRALLLDEEYPLIRRSHGNFNIHSRERRVLCGC